jgi:hypothetical protein
MDHQTAPAMEEPVHDLHNQGSTHSGKKSNDVGNVASVRDTSEVLRIVKDYCQDVSKRQQLLDGIGRTSSGNITLSSFQLSVCSSHSLHIPSDVRELPEETHNTICTAQYGA